MDKNGVWRAMAIALVVAMAALLLLGWQYRQLEEKRLPALQRQIEQQSEEINKRAAQNALEGFMASRIRGDEPQFIKVRYLTENAVEQERLGIFTLLDDYISFKILNSEQTAANEFRFTVELRTKTGNVFVEIITLIKLLDTYYINSIQLAG